MNVILKISLFGIKDLLRNKWSLFYTAFFILATDGLLRMVVEPSKVILSLMNIALFLIPLVSIVFGTLHFYGSREFFKLLLAQPVGRVSVFLGTVVGLSTTLCLSFTVGTLLPLVLHGLPATEHMLSLLLVLAIGNALTWVFVGLSFLVAVSINDRGRGVGLTVFTWLVFAVLYDGAVLLVAQSFSSYPLENTMLALSVANPIDLSRMLILMKMDISALMGYTGAVFERFFGSSLGALVSAGFLALWVIMPTSLGVRQFVRKDL